MEKVLIVAKTRMKSGACVSGLVLSSNRSIRLIPQGRFNQSANTNYEVGQVWEIEMQEVLYATAPHTEDVNVLSQKYVGRVADTKLRSLLLQRVKPWQGGPEKLFDGLLTIDQTKCYISKVGPLPQMSTGFWLPDRALILDAQTESKLYYVMDYQYKVDQRIYTKRLSTKFVGFAPPLQKLPPQTLIRVSLARWFSVANEDRCYLQISGWYL